MWKTAAAVLLLLVPVTIVQGEMSLLSTTELDVHCDPAEETLASFEAWYANIGTGTKCWMHIGHHQYFIGREDIYALQHVTGTVRATEQHLSPPTEMSGTSGGRVYSAIPVEVSMDGRSWIPVGQVNYQLAPVVNKQTIDFSFAASGEEFRYLRIREPHSSAEGLSGYLDHSNFTLQVTDAGDPSTTLVSQTVSLSCALHIMEGIFASHPCTFGGNNRWDSASVFHTYPLDGLASIDEISGTVVVAENFRREGNLDHEAIPDVETKILVQVSTFGTAWDTVASVKTMYNVPADFSVTLSPSVDARFVRYATEPHFLWNNTGFPTAKHPEGFFTFSELEVTGMISDTL